MFLPELATAIVTIRIALANTARSMPLSDMSFRGRSSGPSKVVPHGVVYEKAARGALGVAQRAAVGDAGGHRRSSEKVRVATPGTNDGDDDDRRQNGADRAG